ncbi:NAD(+)/NADH kinase [Candidatus Woesearchaeota archaeon]|nr:NAD(+)/NADH kinase [Candidatus Woesearchaeota archaeon]
MRLKNVLVVHKMGYSGEEKKTVDVLLAVLKKNKILHRFVSRLEVNHEIVKGRDLIIIVGGDGTFLKVAQFTQDAVPFLCINADPKNTEGFFSTTTAENVEKKLRQIRSRNAKPKKIYRLAAKINGIEIENCTNEYYVGEQKPYDVAKYLLKVGKKAELQKSSGVLVCTAAGSTAWCRGAGGKVLPMNAQKFQYIVREPYVGKLVTTKMKKGVLAKKDMITIVAKGDGIVVVADAIGREHEVKREMKVEIRMSEKPVLLYY